jgi:hypothetical protein
MTPEHVKKLLPIFQAYTEGKPLQLRMLDKWVDLTGNNVTFCHEPEDYRVKPEPVTKWVNIYESHSIAGYDSKANADSMAGKTRIACISYTYTEGEGL